MARKRPLLDRMLDNPAADWTISDIERLCREEGLQVRPPAHGSHFTVFSDALDGILTVPARRPIKPVYIRKLASLVLAHRKAKQP